MSRMPRIASWLESIARRLKNRGGFWFPAVKWFINRAYHFVSIGYRLNMYLDDKSLGGPWVSEFYQFVGVLFGILWIALIECPVLTGLIWVVFGLLLAFHRVAEIVLFSLHWLLVAEASVSSSRRSLLGFLLNLCEIGIYFTVAYLLLGWFAPSEDAWAALYASLSSVFSLTVPTGLRDAGWPQAIARVQLAISWMLVALIVANVVGAIDRSENSQKP